MSSSGPPAPGASTPASRSSERLALSRPSARRVKAATSLIGRSSMKISSCSGRFAGAGGPVEAGAGAAAGDGAGAAALAEVR